MTEDEQARVSRLSVGEGDDVGGDPDEIQREIEHTRAELAETIDAIAERVSPRRAAARGAQRMRSAVEAVFSREESLNGEGPAALIDAPPERAALGGAPGGGAAEYRTERVLRVDRVVLVVGAAAAVGALVVFLRRRR